MLFRFDLVPFLFIIVLDLLKEERFGDDPPDYKDRSESILSFVTTFVGVVSSSVNLSCFIMLKSSSDIRKLGFFFVL